jgi:hypothetical protein
MNTQKTDKSRDNKNDINLVGLDDFFEDMFGLNMRGLKTLKLSFTNPKVLYEAARSSDWEGKYTPSFRLWFSIIAFIFFLQFFWANPEGAITENITIQAEQFLTQIKNSGGTIPANVTAKIIATKYMKWYLWLAPIFSAIFLVCLAIPYRAWGKTTPFVIRQRNIFLTILPSTALSFIFIVANTFGGIEKILAISLFTSVLTAIIDLITAYRGAFPDKSIWRSIALALAIQAANLIGLTFASLISIICVVIYYF